MKTQALVGLVLIVVGILALVYQGITYTTREEVVDLGPLEVTSESRETLPLPPVIGGGAVVIGAVLLIAGNRRS